MAIIKDVPNKVSSSTQPAILSRKSYDKNKIQVSGKNFNKYEEIYIDDEQNKSSYVKDLDPDPESEIISMYETASLFLSCQNTDGSDFDSLFTPKSNSTYVYVENLNYSSHQSQFKNNICPQKPRSHSIYSMQMKRCTRQSMPPIIAKERIVNHSNCEDTEIEGPIFSKPLELLSIFPLNVENSLPLLVIQSDGKENFYSHRQILSSLDSSPLSPILNTTKKLGYEKPIRKEEMINFYASTPLSPSFVSRKLQIVSSSHHNYAENSCFGGYMQKEPLSNSTRPLIMCNKSSKDQKNFSQNSFKVSNTFQNPSEANYFADRSSVNVLHFASLSMPQIAQKSHRITTSDSCVNFPIGENKENHLDIRESKYERYRAHDSRFELSTNSNKFLDSHRTSYTTIDQIEIDLYSKSDETSPQMVCCESLNALSSCEGVGYTTSTTDTISKKSQSGQINSKLKINQKYRSLSLFKPLETKNTFREAACSKIFSRIPSSQLASKYKTRTTEISSSKAEISRNQPLLISSENYFRYGLKIDGPDTTSLGDVSFNQQKIFEAYDMNYLDNSALNCLPENRNQNCRDLEYDKFAHGQGSYVLDKTTSLPIYDYNLTTPKPIPSINQMKLEKSRPQLMKPFPPLPAVGCAEAGKNLSIKDKLSDHELPLRFSPWLADSKTNSLQTECDESSGLKFSLPLKTMIHTDIDADKKIARKIKSHNHDNNNNNQKKRSPPKLRLKPKKLQSFSSCPSISGYLDSISQDDHSTAVALPNTNLDLDRCNILKSTRLRLKYPQAQTLCNGTVHTRKVPNSVTYTANVPHSNPSDLFNSHGYSNDIFGETINDLQSRRPSLDSDNLITSLPVSNIKTNGRKRIKKKEFFSGSPRGCLKPLDSSNVFESRLRISDNCSRIENCDEMRKKFGNSRYRKEPLYTAGQNIRSKDEIPYRSSNNLKFQSIRTPNSTPNLHRKYFESVPCLRKEPQGQNLKAKIRDWIKSARSAISIRIESQAKVWRKK